MPLTDSYKTRSPAFLLPETKHWNYEETIYAIISYGGITRKLTDCFS
ncbi:hypothetical protein FLA_0373 [Filimonas lacunae]|nr:hypothetical protein FLA_0373 [Filimonas lacunae]